MSLYSIIKRPIVTEKSARPINGEEIYCVEVAPTATKIDLKKAFLEIYWVEVEKVNILNTLEKFKKWNKWMHSKRKGIRKAYITLKDGQNSKIDFSVLK